MDFSFSEAEESFRQEVREFLVKELPPGWGKRIMLPMTDTHESKETWAMRQQLAPKVAEKGWLTMGWPKEYGGAGASRVMELIFEEEICYHGAPARDSFGIGMLAPALIRFGTEEQKLKHLTPIGRGEIFWCEGFSEPEAGSDVAAIQTRAVEKDDSFIVNGQKIWTTGAHNADWCFFLVRTDPDAPKHRGISFLLVDMKTPGITVRPIISIDDMHDFNEIYFDDVEVPKENLIGGKNQGWAVTMALLDYERSWIEPVAVTRRLLEVLVEYLRESNPDSLKQPLTRQRLAEIAIEADVARLLSYRVAWLEDNGIDATYQASISKIFSTELIQRASSTGMQLLGLYSQLKEGSPRVPMLGRIPLRYFSTIGWTLAAGTTEIQKNVIALRGLGLPRS